VRGMEAKTETQIEYENVTVKVPKNIMRLLRDRQEDVEMSPTEYLEYVIVQIVHADIDVEEVFAPRPEKLIERYGLKPIFEKILNDC